MTEQTKNLHLSPVKVTKCICKSRQKVKAWRITSFPPPQVCGRRKEYLELPPPFRIFHGRSSIRRVVQKQNIRSLFDSIAHRYDFLNHLLSGGSDYLWRRRAIDHLRDLHPLSILDVATGTADFALAAMQLGPQEVVGIDISEQMLNRGRAKIIRRGFDRTIALRTGDAENLEFPNDRFDAAIVAFGARNFENLERGLSEMFRTLRPGGRIVVLEFSRPSLFPVKQLYFFYFRRILPLIGRIVSGDRQAYNHLPETVMRFPQGEAFLAILRKIGFALAEDDRLTFGIASIYTGTKLLR